MQKTMLADPQGLGAVPLATLGGFNKVGRSV
jgi:hypothetical protein